MRWFAILIGLILIVFGILAFTDQFPGKMFSFTSTSESRDGVKIEQDSPAPADDKLDVEVNIPGVESENTERSSFPLAPVLGVIAILGGLVLVGKAISGRTHSHHHHRDVHVS